MFFDVIGRFAPKTRATFVITRVKPRYDTDVANGAMCQVFIHALSLFWKGLDAQNFLVNPLMPTLMPS